MDHFNNTVIQENERYQVVWPWKNEDINLPENYDLSHGRPESLHEEIVEVPYVLCKCDNIIKDQREKKYYSKSQREDWRKRKETIHSESCGGHTSKGYYQIWCQMLPQKRRKQI